jgi:putative DNA methylase
MTTFADIFTSRQLCAVGTFAKLVAEARDEVVRDAMDAGIADDNQPLQEAGSAIAAMFVLSVSM